MQQLLYLVHLLYSLKITTKVSPHVFINWTPQERQIKQKCHCGKFACIGYPAEYGNLELLCFKHYEERKNECHLSKDIPKSQSPKILKPKSKQVEVENKQSLLL